MSLTAANLKELYVTTFEARTKWRNILLMLGVPSASIDSVGIKWRDNPDDCYREGLSEWLKSGERSRIDLMEALASPVVGHNDIAMLIGNGDYERRPILSSLSFSASQLPLGKIIHYKYYMACI